MVQPINIDEIYLKALGSEIFVLGHKNPDVDSLVSTYLMAKILKHFNINATPSILIPIEQVDLFTKEVLNDFGISLSEFNYIRPKINDLFFLVDHNDVSESIGEGFEVLGVIDHHSKITTLQNVCIKEFDSNSLLIFDIFRHKYDFSTLEKKQILISTMIDTCFLKSSRTQKENNHLIKMLVSEHSNLECYISQLEDKYFVGSDFSKSIEELALNGTKEHSICDELIISSYIEHKNSLDIKVIDSLRDYIQEESKRLSLKRLFIIFNIEEGNTKALYFKDGNLTIKLNYNCIASRGSKVIPDLKKFLNKMKHA